METDLAEVLLSNGLSYPIILGRVGIDSTIETIQDYLDQNTRWFGFRLRGGQTLIVDPRTVVGFVR